MLDPLDAADGALEGQGTGIPCPPLPFSAVPSLKALALGFIGRNLQAVRARPDSSSTKTKTHSKTYAVRTHPAPTEPRGRQVESLEGVPGELCEVLCCIGHARGELRRGRCCHSVAALRPI
jgi:hypothetical protein